MSKIKVMKFGGTSVGKPERMHEVARLITKDSEPTIVVLSAVSGTTNSLVEIGSLLEKGEKEGAKNRIAALQRQYEDFISKLLTSPTHLEKATAVLEEHFEFLSIILRISFNEALNKDILAQGELLSTKLFSIYLEQEEIRHALVPALDFMRVDEFGEPQVEEIRAKLLPIINNNKDKVLFITQGFICKNHKGEVDNLKRGGSDYSASLIAAASGASVCEIWTDIDGMHNNDPRVVENTKPVRKLSFDEAAELAYFGAKILHPASIWPAQQYKVPVRLLNTMNPEAEGTLIQEEAEGSGVKAIAAKENITAINIRSSRMLLAYGFLRKVFEVFEKYRTPIDMITTSEVAVSLTIDNDAELQNILRELKLFSTVQVDSGQSIISIVGNEVAKNKGTLKNVFAGLDELKIRMVSFGGSEHNISILVDGKDKQGVLTRLNEVLF